MVVVIGGLMLASMKTRLYGKIVRRKSPARRIIFSVTHFISLQRFGWNIVNIVSFSFSCLFSFSVAK